MVLFVFETRAISNICSSYTQSNLYDSSCDACNVVEPLTSAGQEDCVCGAV